MTMQLAAQQTPTPHGLTKSEAVLESRLRKVIDAGPAAIDERLEELDSEWTAGRISKATAGVMVVGGLVLSLTISLWWLVLPIVGGAILLQYLFGRTSLVGELFHAIGFRRGADIEQEKFALRALRGDFTHLPTMQTIEDRDALSRMEGEGGPAIEDAHEKHDADKAVKVLVEVARH